MTKWKEITVERRSSRRWKPVLVSLVVSVVVSAVAYVFLNPPPEPIIPGVSLANFHRLCKGMPRSEVEDILGASGTDSGHNGFIWTSPTARIELYFDEKGTVRMGSYEEPHRGERIQTREDLWTREFRRRLRLPPLSGQ